MIKAVLFDVDGVLIQSFEANLRFYQDLLKLAGYRMPTREEMAGMYHLTMEDVIRRYVPGGNEGEVKRIWKLGRDRAVRYPDELLSVPGGA